MIGDLGGATRHLLSRECLPTKESRLWRSRLHLPGLEGPQDPAPLHSCCLPSLPLAIAPISFKGQKWGDRRKGEGRSGGSLVRMGPALLPLTTASLGLNHLHLGAAHPAFSSCPAGLRLSRDPIPGLRPTVFYKCILTPQPGATHYRTLHTHTHTHRPAPRYLAARTRSGGWRPPAPPVGDSPPGRRARPCQAVCCGPP